MFRLAFACVLIASVVANRVQIDRHQDVSQFGASCEHLETVFHNRVVAFHGALEAHPDVNEIGRTRMTIRSYGVVRTLRRARTCPWVVDGHSGDIKQARGIVQVLLAANPCGEAARAELEAGSSAETSELEIESVRRSMTILLSDTCEVTEAPDSAPVNSEAELDVQLRELDAEVQDAVDELEDASEVEGGAFIQSDAGTYRGFMRSLGVAFLLLLFLLACTAAVAVIGLLIGFTLSILALLAFTYFNPGTGPLVDALGAAEIAFLSGFLGGALGLATCGSHLLTELLPRLNQSGISQ